MAAKLEIRWLRVLAVVLSMALVSGTIVLLLASQGCRSILSGGPDAETSPTSASGVKDVTPAGPLGPADGALVVPAGSDENLLHRRLSVLLSDDDVSELFNTREDQFLKYATVSVATVVILLTVSTFNPIKINDQEEDKK